jgi:hypothetical protein
MKLRLNFTSVLLHTRCLDDDQHIANNGYQYGNQKRKGAGSCALSPSGTREASRTGRSVSRSDRILTSASPSLLTFGGSGATIPGSTPAHTTITPLSSPTPMPMAAPTCSEYNNTYMGFNNIPELWCYYNDHGPFSIIPGATTSYYPYSTIPGQTISLTLKTISASINTAYSINH